jgi:hypothetical protein
VQECGTALVALRPITPVMRLAIDFDDKLRCAAVEVRDIGIDWVLLAKSHA